MSFEVLIVLISIVLSVASMLLVRSNRINLDVPRWKKWFTGFLAFFSAFFMVSMITYFVAPKGSALHEVTRIAKHGYHIYQQPIKDLAYQKIVYGEDKNQYALYFEAPEDELKKDIIVYFVHGGGWKFGDPEFYRPYAKYFVDLGYDVVLPTYRRISKTNNVEVLKEDIINGYLTVMEELDHKTDREILADFEGSFKPVKKKVILGGDSAGGHLSGLLMFDKRIHAEHDIDIERVIGFVSIVGALNLNRMKPSKVMELLVNGKGSPLLNDNNPFEFLPSVEVPTLCIHGTTDGLVDYRCSKSFVESMNFYYPNSTTFLTIEGGTHYSAGAAWVYEDNEVRTIMENWLENL